jgi:hypothetical protein
LNQRESVGILEPATWRPSLLGRRLDVLDYDSVRGTALGFELKAPVLAEGRE